MSEREQVPRLFSVPGEKVGLRVLIWKVPNSMLEHRKSKVWSSWVQASCVGHAGHLPLGDIPVSLKEL